MKKCDCELWEKNIGLISGPCITHHPYTGDFFTYCPWCCKKLYDDAVVFKNHISPGLWKHFKGDVYEVIAVGKHSEDGSEMVIYKKGFDYHVRPVSEWFDLKGNQYRFTKIN